MCESSFRGKKKNPPGWIPPRGIIRKNSVLFLSLKTQRMSCACSYTGWLKSCIYSVHTIITLANYIAVGMENRDIPRAGRYARLASDAKLLIDIYQPIGFSTNHRLCRTCFDASGILAMIAASEGCLHDDFAILEFRSPGRMHRVFDADRVVVLDLAVHLAGFAVDATLLVQFHSVLAHRCLP
jgi:hypothetical protein